MYEANLQTFGLTCSVLQVVAVLLKAQFLLSVTSLVCVNAKTTMTVLGVTGAKWGITAIQDVSNVPVTLGDQFTSFVKQEQGGANVKEASVVLTVIAVAVAFMDFLIVKLVSAILLGLNHFQMDNWLTVPCQMR